MLRFALILIGLNVLAGCIVVPSNPNGRMTVHTPAPRLYHYYPDQQVYFDVQRRVYFYRTGNRWIRTVQLPPDRTLDDYRVSLTIRGTPYRHHFRHRDRYPPRPTAAPMLETVEEVYQDEPPRHRVRGAPPPKTVYHQYWYYPSSRIYYDVTKHVYYLPSANRWVRVKRLPSRYRIDPKERVSLRESGNRPYVRHHEHARRYPGTHHRHAVRMEPSKQAGVVNNRRLSQTQSSQTQSLARNRERQQNARRQPDQQYRQNQRRRSRQQTGRQQQLRHATQHQTQQQRQQNRQRQVASQHQARNRHQQLAQTNRASSRHDHRSSARGRHPTPATASPRLASRHAGGHSTTHGHRAGGKPRHVFRYYPSSQVYYDLKRKVYYYQRKGQWLQARALPKYIRLHKQKSVNIRMSSTVPYTNHKEHKKKYPPEKR